LTGAVAAEPTVQPMSIFGAVLTVVWDAELETPNVNGIVGYPVLGIVCTVPDDAETIGTLKLGADDHGLVAAVAVTVWTEDNVTVPDETATSDVPPDEATMTSGAEVRAIRPDEAETIGMLNPGAELHGLVAAVAVTVWTDDSVTVPDDSAVRNVPPDVATMTSGALLRLTSVDAEIVPARIVTPNPPEVVTGAMPEDVPTRLNIGVLLRLTAVEAEMVPATMVTFRPPEVVTVAAPPEVPTMLIAVEPDAAPPRIVTPRPPEVVTGATPSEVPTMLTYGAEERLTAVEAEIVPPTMVTDSPPEVVTGATPDDVPTRLKYGVELRLTAVEAEMLPPRMVTPRPPDVVAGITPEDVPTILTVVVPEIWTRPDDAETTEMLNAGALLHGFVAAVAVTVGVPEIWTRPDETETTGILKPGADDQGFVPSVAVTDPEICTSPDEALTIGTLKPGAEDQGLVAAVAVTVPEVIARSAVPPEEATITSGAEDSVIRPELRLARRPAEVVTGATAVEAAAPTTRTCRCWDDETWKLSMFWPDVPGAGGTLTKGIT
jgi:hypothetical protein